MALVFDNIRLLLNLGLVNSFYDRELPVPLRPVSSPTEKMLDMLKISVLKIIYLLLIRSDIVNQYKGGGQKKINFIN